MVRLKLAAALLTGAAAASVYWGCLFMDHAAQDAQSIADAIGRNAQEVREHVISDRPVTEGSWMPLWLQKDPQWSDVPYSDGTIGTYGCGLTCAAMAIKYLTVQDVTPLSLCGSVGEQCLTDRVNDMEKFSKWIASNYGDYGVEHSGQFWGIDKALSMVDDGWIVMAGMEGPLGERSYGSHVVLIWDVDESGNYWVRDPDDASNSEREFTREELEAVAWGSFNGLKGGHYGS